MNDPFGRKVDYLRISVTDRCNERCLYCMPEGYKGWEQRSDHLSAEEIIRVVRVAADLGFRKFRLTGGEPLVRGDLAEIVRGMAAIPGVEIIGLSTNGTQLAAYADSLRTAGLRTVNVSLDALDPEIYHRVTGGRVKDVLAGIRAAVVAGFERVKLNCVLMRGKNETEIWPLALFAAEHDLPRNENLLPERSEYAFRFRSPPYPSKNRGCSGSFASGQTFRRNQPEARPLFFHSRQVAEIAAKPFDKVCIVCILSA